MNPFVWNRLDAEYERFPILKAGPVSRAEVEEAAKAVGLKFPAAYEEFLERYGSAMLGPYPIFGLRPVEPMGEAWSVVEMNRRFRDEGWPGLDDRLIFTHDQGGNPIAVSSSDGVWIVDHDHGGLAKLSPSFESFVIDVLKSLED